MGFNHSDRVMEMDEDMFLHEYKDAQITNSMAVIGFPSVGVGKLHSRQLHCQDDEVGADRHHHLQGFSALHDTA